MVVKIEGIGRIEASRDVLNYISTLASEARDSFEDRGRTSLANLAEKVANGIYDTLDATNYYPH